LPPTPARGCTSFARSASPSRQAAKRAGLDYHDYARDEVHPNWPACRAALAGEAAVRVTDARRAQTCYAEMRYREGDALVFGRKRGGLPDAILGEFSPGTRLMLPMRAR
jgi:tRNA (cytidine/uridine-2'-O-)-methyltransferase